MSGPTRSDAGGKAYLDLRTRARREGRPTQELLVLYVLERFLARLTASPYADQFVLKGGLLLAVLDVRRPTVDADVLARGLANDEELVVRRVIAIADQRLADNDGVQFDAASATAETIREGDLYAGVRVAMDCAVATARVRLRLDVNFGDPVTPAPQRIDYPTLLDTPPISILGYPVETVIAEKLTTAIDLGDANTRVRDYIDLWRLTGRHDLDAASVRQAVTATSEFRRVVLVPLTTALSSFADNRQTAYATLRANLGTDGDLLPPRLADLLDDVARFADPVVDGSVTDGAVWQSHSRRWIPRP